MIRGATTTAADRVIFTCSHCGPLADGMVVRCDSCGGPIHPCYPDAAPPTLWEGPADAVIRYGDVLPVDDRSLYRLPVPATPLVELDSVDGIKVFAKVEGVLPTGSTKDRLAAVALPFMLERGVRRFAFSSTGNTATAYAHGLHLYPELSARVYLPPTVVDRTTIGPVPPNMDVVLVDSDYAGASSRVRDHAARNDFVPEGGFFNIGRREGAKLAYLEAFEQLDQTGVQTGAVVQAVASGLGIYAAARAVSELRRAGRSLHAPKLFCVQQASCAPMVEAHQAEKQGKAWRRVLLHPRGVAPALLLGDPTASYEYVAAAVRASEGSFIGIPDDRVSEVLRRHADPAIPLGASAAVALAAVADVIRTAGLRRGEALLVMLTGGPGR